MTLGKVDEPEGGGGTVGIGTPFKTVDSPGFWTGLWRKIKGFFRAIF
jgi:hypothetical protein